MNSGCHEIKDIQSDSEPVNGGQTMLRGSQNVS